MELKNFFAQDESGNLLPAATCTLYLADGTTLATGLKDKAGAALTNPWTTGADGLVSVQAPDGTYQLKVEKASRNYTLQVKFYDSGALGPFATVSLMETGVPAANFPGRVALVGAASPYLEYTSDGTKWTLRRLDKQTSGYAKYANLIARAVAVTKGRKAVSAPLASGVISTAPLAVWDMVKLIPGYAGPCCKVRRSDGVEKDIPFLADGIVDSDLMIAFAGTLTLTLSVFYDQTGGGNHMTQTDTTIQPFVDIAFLRNGMPGIQGGTKSSVNRCMNIPAGVAVTSTANCAIWAAVGTLNGRNSVTPWNLGSGENMLGLTITAGSVHSASPKIGSAAGLHFGSPNYASLAPSNGVVCGLNCGPTGASATKYFMRDFTATRAALSSVATAGGTWPLAATGSVEQYGLVIFNSVLTDADATLFHRLMSKAHCIGMEASANVVLCGDSIVESAITGNYNYNTTLVHYLPPEVTLFNVGVGGQTLQTESTEVATRCAGFFKAGIPNIGVCTGGVNDITLGGVGVAANMEGYATTWHAAMRTAGFKVMHATLFPRVIDGTVFTNAKETERMAFNNFLRKSYGTGRLLDGIVDFEDEPYFLPRISAGDFPDNLHPGSASGYPRAGAILADRIIGQLPGLY